MKKQLRQTCKELVNGKPCGATYRYPADFEEHQRIAHKPVDPQAANRPTFSDKDAEEGLSAVEVLEDVQPAPVAKEAKPQPKPKRSKKK